MPGTTRRQLDRDTWRRILAVTTGGSLVTFGVVGTFAAWSDSTWTQGQFTAATWNLQIADGDTGGTFTESSSTTPATLTLTMPTGGMSPVNAGATENPTEAVYRPFRLNLIASPGAPGASVVVSNVTAGGGPVAAELEYEIRMGGAVAGCTQSGFASYGTVMVADKTPVTTANPAEVALPITNTISADDVALLCLKVQIKAQTATDPSQYSWYSNAAAATVKWEFTGTQV